MPSWWTMVWFTVDRLVNFTLEEYYNRKNKSELFREKLYGAVLKGYNREKNQRLKNISEKTMNYNEEQEKKGSKCQ